MTSALTHLNQYDKIIPEFEDFMAAIRRPLPATVRVNTLKTSPQRLLRRFDEAKIACKQREWYSCCLEIESRPGRLMEHTMGLIHVQEEISMVPPVVLGARPDEAVLDLCAAPGGKTTQIAQMMGNKGTVVANEPSAGRIVPLRANCERMGALNVVVTKHDGRRFPNFRFDRVLVDAPCSGEGMARRDQSVINRCSRDRSWDLHVLQKGLLRRALLNTKEGGVVVYSTCTYAPEENEAVIASVKDQVEIDHVDVPGLLYSRGLTSWEGMDFGEEMTGCARFYPHQNDTGGFFVARLIKRKAEH